MNRHPLLNRAAVGGMALCAAVVLGSTVVGVRWFESPEGAATRAESTDAPDASASPSASRFVAEGCGTVAVAAAQERTPGGPTSLLQQNAPERTLGSESSSQPDAVARPARSAAPVSASSAVAASRRRRTGPEALVDALPPSILERARRTAWDDRASESLDRMLLLAFDADGDLELDDLERITAVRAMRDAIWPGALRDAPSHAAESTGAGGASADAPLTREELQRHHDADESRRLDDAMRREQGAEGVNAAVAPLGAERRARAIREFRVLDDGRLTAGEFSRFIGRHRAGSAQADLNDDGLIDEADLRLFLDLASPLGDE